MSESHVQELAEDAQVRMLGEREYSTAKTGGTLRRGDGVESIATQAEDQAAAALTKVVTSLFQVEALSDVPGVGFMNVPTRKQRSRHLLASPTSVDTSIADPEAFFEAHLAEFSSTSKEKTKSRLSPKQDLLMDQQLAEQLVRDGQPSKAMQEQATNVIDRSFQEPSRTTVTPNAQLVLDMKAVIVDMQKWVGHAGAARRATARATDSLKLMAESMDKAYYDFDSSDQGVLLGETERVAQSQILMTQAVELLSSGIKDYEAGIIPAANAYNHGRQLLVDQCFQILKSTNQSTLLGENQAIEWHKSGAMKEAVQPETTFAQGIAEMVDAIGSFYVANNAAKAMLKETSAIWAEFSHSAFAKK